MKPLIPMILALISLPLSAQESPAPATPKPTVKDSKASTSETNKSTSNGRRVILPSKATAKSSNKPQQPTTKTSSSRVSSRRIVLPPNSRTSTTSRVTPRPANTSTGSVRRAPVASSRVAAPSGLQENVTIQLKGSTQAGEALDLSLTGIGPIFQGDVLIGEDATILTHSYSVVPHGSSYLVEFSIGMRIRHLNSTSGQHKNYEFHDNSINGKVLLAPGKPVTVSNNQGKVLVLTISKP